MAFSCVNFDIIVVELHQTLYFISQSKANRHQSQTLWSPHSNIVLLCAATTPKTISHKIIYIILVVSKIHNGNVFACSIFLSLDLRQTKRFQWKKFRIYVLDITPTFSNRMHTRAIHIAQPDADRLVQRFSVSLHLIFAYHIF